MTSKKRGYREGAVDQRGPNTWRLRFRTDGKRHTRTVSGSRTDAQRALRTALKAIDDGIHVAPTAVTVAEFLTKWDADWAANNISAAIEAGSPQAFDRIVNSDPEMQATFLRWRGHLALAARAFYRMQMQAYNEL